MLPGSGRGEMPYAGIGTEGVVSCACDRGRRRGVGGAGGGGAPYTGVDGGTGTADPVDASWVAGGVGGGGGIGGGPP